MSKQELRLLNVLYDVNIPPSKISTILNTIRDDNRGTFLPKTLFNVNENAGIWLMLQMESYQRSDAAKDSEVPLSVSLYLWCILFVIKYNSCLDFFLVFSKDIDYYCVMHVSGQGLISEAKGRPKGGSRIKLPFSDSKQEKMLELRRDFQLHNDTQLIVMLSIWTKEMNRYVSMFPEVWFSDCTAGEFVYSVLHRL